jgi:hypothetical protein
MSLAPVFSLLASTGAVTAIIGTSPVRCFPAGSIPQAAGTDPNVSLPCVTWQAIGGTPENVLGDRPPSDHVRV